MNLFLGKEQIAQALGTTPGVAAALLSERGVNPVDWGRGRGRGLRWYAPAVKQAALDMHEEVQRKAAAPAKKKARAPQVGYVSGRSAAELFAELTNQPALQ